MSAPAHPHLHPAVRELADKDDVARIAHVRAKRWVEHRAASGLLELLDEVFEQPSSERMENLLILGESGMGKTALLRAFERRHAAPWDEARGVHPRPVLVVRMPPVPTEKELFLKVLETLGVPSDLGGGNAFQRRETTFQVLREVGTRVLVLD